MELNKDKIQEQYSKFMESYNPSTEIGTSEFKIFTSLGLFVKRGVTIWHCLKELANEKKTNFKVFSYEMVQNSRIK